MSHYSHIDTSEYEMKVIEQMFEEGEFDLYSFNDEVRHKIFNRVMIMIDERLIGQAESYCEGER
jgi:hypothetical protein